MPNENKHSFAYTSHVLTRSQSVRPEVLLDVLVISSVKENWIILLINLHTAIFFSIFLLTSDFKTLDSLYFLSAHMVATVLSGSILTVLTRSTEAALLNNRKVTAWLLVLCDSSISISWGLSIAYLLTQSQINEFNLLFSLLLAAGVSTAALSAKLLRVLILGRLMVFLPTLIFLIAQQNPDWLLHSISIILCFIIALGIGYAIHIQLLREASLVVEINEARTRTDQEAAFREYFLRSITHDLLQPLSSIKLFTRGLRKSSPEMERKHEIISIEMCLASADEILDNVAQLVWVKDQLPRPNMVPVSIDHVLNKLIRIYKHKTAEKGLSINYVKTSLYALSEPSYLERAVRNLLENALEHTQHGKILVGVRNRYSKSQIEIQIFDTGCGIEKKHWGKIFKEYKRVDDSIDAKNNHLGLGLSIVRNIVNSLGGSVTLKSELGIGSCFSILLPAYNKNEITQHRQNIENRANHHAKALIVDDDSEYAKFLSKILLGMEVESHIICELDEIEGLLYKQLPEADFYIIDYHLKHFSGLELLENTSNLRKRILISQVNDPEINALAADKGVSFIPKSDDANTMRLSIDSLIQF